MDALIHDLKYAVRSRQSPGFTVVTALTVMTAACGASSNPTAPSSVASDGSISCAKPIIVGSISVSSANDFAGTGTVCIDGGTLLLQRDFTLGRSLFLGAGGATFREATNGDSLDAFTGPITGPGSLTIDFSAQVALGGSNSFAGGLTVADNATLFVSNDTSLGQQGSGVTLKGGGLLDFMDDVQTSRPLTLIQVGLGGAGTIIPDRHIVTWSGPISGVGGLNIGGGYRSGVGPLAGTLRLLGTNTFQGCVCIGESDVTVEVASDQNFGNASNTVNMWDATLRFAAGFSTARSFGFYGSGLSGNPGSVVDTGPNDVTLSGPVSGGPGQITKIGTGKLILSGPFSFRGPIVTQAGAVIMAQGK